MTYRSSSSFFTFLAYQYRDLLFKLNTEGGPPKYVIKSKDLSFERAAEVTYLSVIFIKAGKSSELIYYNSEN